MLQNFTEDKKNKVVANKKYLSFLRSRAIIILGVLAGGLVLFIILARNFIFTPAITQISPQATENVELETPIVINFSRPVDRRTLSVSISPDIEGEWHFEAPLFNQRFFRRIRFVPNHTLLAETNYQVNINQIQSPLPIGKISSSAFLFTTRSLPKISTVSPKKNKQNIPPTTPIIIELTEPNPDIAEFEFVFDPEIAFETAINKVGDTYTLTPTEPLQQLTKYNLTVFRVGISHDITTREVVHRSEPKKVYNGIFKTIAPPLVSESTPSGSAVFIDTPITIKFTKAMDLESLRANLSVTPDIKPTIKLSEDGMTATVTPAKKLAYGTEYNVLINANTKTQGGGYLEEPVSYKFTTIGEIRVTRTSPHDSATGVGTNSSLQITFDQEVDHVSAEAHIALEPSVSLTFRWEGNTVNAQPTAPFQNNSTYKLNIKNGIVSVHGLNLTKDLSYSFTTEPEVVKLAIASDLQDLPLSCEAAALKMALAGKGISVSENDIMAYVGYDTTPHSGATWGDPYEAFVGNIRGRQNTTGYGVYWGPIARAANHWRPAEAFTGWTVTQITEEISKGNAIVVWGVYGSGYEDSWHTPAGKYIYAWKGEHARTVIGYVGSKENPSQIILNDTYAGQIYWTRARFEQDWSIFGNAGVVVR
ncbi:MAG: Ig-like domain-containing protein [Patescibacteria group bacterium]